MKKQLAHLLILCSMMSVPASYVDAQTGMIMYTDTFLYAQSPSSAQCNAWNTFRAQLTPRCYTKIMIKGTYDTTGQFCTDTVIAANYANALNTLTDYISPSCNGNVWELCNRYNGEVWLNPPFLCSGANCPNPGYIIRPCIGNINWGGVNTPTCWAPNQRMTIVFEFDSTLGTISGIIGPDTSCSGDTVQYAVNWVTGATDYQWTVPNGSSVIAGQGTKNITVVFGTTSGSVDLTASNTCDSTTASLSVTIGVSPQITLTNDTFICRNDSIQIDAGGGVFYSWSPAAGLNCTNCSSVSASPDSTTVYVLSASDSIGCTSIDSVQITVINTVASAGPDTLICLGDSIQLSATGGVTYGWNPSTGLSCSNCPDPIAYPDTSTYYVLTVTDSFGCTATDTLFIEVVECPGMDEYAMQDQIITIPNPSDGNMILRIVDPSFANSDIYIFSTEGKIIYQMLIKETGDYPVHIRSCAKGLYYLKAINSKRVFIRKLIVQ